MQKLLETYKEECAIKSKAASVIWKMGIVILSILYIKFAYGGQNYFKMFVIFLIAIAILYIICLEIFRTQAFKKMNSFKKNEIKNKKIRQTYLEIDKYQKDWISCYCKKNKINQISKLKIIRESLNNEEKERTIRYINPLIIGTLLFTIWEMGLEKVSEQIGFTNMIILSIVIAILISVIIGVIRKEFLENKKTFLEFDRFANNKRLEDLLLYEILKCKK